MFGIYADYDDDDAWKCVKNNDADLQLKRVGMQVRNISVAAPYGHFRISRVMIRWYFDPGKCYDDEDVQHIHWQCFLIFWFHSLLCPQSRSTSSWSTSSPWWRWSPASPWSSSSYWVLPEGRCQVSRCSVASVVLSATSVVPCVSKCGGATASV